jgi:hypothetical protein
MNKNQNDRHKIMLKNQQQQQQQRKVIEYHLNVSTRVEIISE